MAKSSRKEDDTYTWITLHMISLPLRTACCALKYASDAYKCTDSGHRTDSVPCQEHKSPNTTQRQTNTPYLDYADTQGAR